MPNWCYNSLTVDGSAEDVAKVKAQVSAPFTAVHENWNMETQKMESKVYSYDNPIFAFHNIYNHIQDGVPEEVYQAQGTDSGDLKEALMFKGNNWYDWNVRNWGTKWDVAVSNDEKYPDTYIADENTTGLSYTFNTAWSPPIEAITKLSEQYPDVTFNLSYEEETGWGGEVEFENGAHTTLEEYENKCRDCEALNSMEYCDNDCGEICNECNYLGEADLDCVAECDTHKVYLDEDHVPDYRMDQVNA